MEERNYKVVFYMKDGNKLDFEFLNTTIENVIAGLNVFNLGSANTFIRKLQEYKFINVNEIKYFEIQELVQEANEVEESK